VQADGSVTDGEQFLDAKPDSAPGGPDGMRVDQEGNIYGSGPGGVWIISPQGKHLGTIKVPEIVANVAWGDKDAKTLYIVASTGVYKVRTKVAGVRN
jgi:gluconolactonase